MITAEINLFNITTTFTIITTTTTFSIIMTFTEQTNNQKQSKKHKQILKKLLVITMEQVIKCYFKLLNVERKNLLIFQ